MKKRSKPTKKKTKKPVIKPGRRMPAIGDLYAYDGKYYRVIFTNNDLFWIGAMQDHVGPDGEPFFTGVSIAYVKPSGEVVKC